MDLAAIPGERQSSQFPRTCTLVAARSCSENVIPSGDRHGETCSLAARLCRSAKAFATAAQGSALLRPDAPSCPGNGVSSLLQHISDKERRKRTIGFEKACNGTGDDRRRKAGALHMLIVGSDLLQFCDAAVRVWIPLLATDKQILCFLGDRSIGSTGAATQMLGATKSGLGTSLLTVP